LSLNPAVGTCTGGPPCTGITSVNRPRAAGWPSARTSEMVRIFAGFVAKLHLRRFVLWSLPAIYSAQRGRTTMAISFKGAHFPVVLEKSNVAQLASNLYPPVHSLPEEDHHDTNDASAAEIYPILVSESTVFMLQSPRRREHRASVVDRHAQTHRTAALHPVRPGVL